MIEFHPVTKHIGAEVTGVDLRKPLSQEEVATLREGWLKHLVLFFRDQHIDDEQHLQFALNFGTLNHPAFKKDSASPIHVRNRRAGTGRSASNANPRSTSGSFRPRIPAIRPWNALIANPLSRTHSDWARRSVPPEPA